MYKGGIFTMTSENAKKLAHELTMEYLRANPEYLRHTRDEAQKMVNQIAEVNKNFYDCLVKNETLSDLY